METSPSQKSAAALKRPSCLLCNQRKVKCDKQVNSTLRLFSEFLLNDQYGQDPCSNCTKSRTQCVFKPHAVPRRGKARPKETDLLVRLRRCEALLEHNGINVKQALPEGSEIAARPDAQDHDEGVEANDQRLTSSHVGHHKGHSAHKHPGTLITRGERSMYLEKWVHRMSGLLSDANDLRQPFVDGT